MTKLDLGCGFDESVGHSSLKDAIGIDLNFMRGQAAVDYPIIGDVNYIPIRCRCVDFIHAHSILEHLPRPHLCLNEMARTMKVGATGSILLPLNANMPIQILRRFIKEFPFSLGWVLEKLVRTITIWRLPGMLHITQISVEDIEKWFKVDHDKIEYRRRLHKWFVHIAPFSIFCRLGWIRRLEVDEYAEVVIPINQTPKESANK